MPHTAAEHPLQELANEEVRVAVHRKPLCRIEIHVKTSKALVQKARKNALKTVGREVSLPGFRKGHAPQEVILKKYPKEIERELHNSLANLSFAEAQKLARVPVLNNNSPVSFDLKSQSEDDAELVFSFETEPKIPAIDPKLFSPKPIQKAEVGEKQIDEAIRQMQFFYAKWNLIQGRPIQEGDYIMIDLDTIEGETVQKVFHHIRFEVSSERMASWMKKLVLGAQAGDLLEGFSEPDTLSTPEDLATFKPKKVRVNILKAEEAVLPELTDEFAKSVGAPDLIQMRESIASLLSKQVEEKAHSELCEQVNEFLTTHYPFELPLSLIDAEKKHRQTQHMEDPKFKANWTKLSSEERKKFEEHLFHESAQAVRLFYLSRQVARDAKVPVTHKDIQDEAIAILQSHGNQTVEIEQIPKEVYALALSKVILAKAQDYVIRQQKA